MVGDLGGSDHVRELNDSVRVDHKGDAACERGVAVVRVAGCSVLLTDRSLPIGQEGKREVVAGGKLQVLGGRVERYADDRRSERLKFRGSVTEPAALDRSTSRRRLRVPPQHDPAATEVRESCVPLMLVGGNKVGRRGLRKQHGAGYYRRTGTDSVRVPWAPRRTRPGSRRIAHEEQS